MVVVSEHMMIQMETGQLLQLLNYEVTPDDQMV